MTEPRDLKIPLHGNWSDALVEAFAQEVLHQVERGSYFKRLSDGIVKYPPLRADWVPEEATLSVPGALGIPPDRLRIVRKDREKERTNND